jgi:hypothetical protein
LPSFERHSSRNGQIRALLKKQVAAKFGMRSGSWQPLALSMVAQPRKTQPLLPSKVLWKDQSRFAAPWQEANCIEDS